MGNIFQSDSQSETDPAKKFPYETIEEYARHLQNLQNLQDLHKRGMINTLVPVSLNTKESTFLDAYPDPQKKEDYTRLFYEERARITGEPLSTNPQVASNNSVQDQQSTQSSPAAPTNPVIKATPDHDNNPLIICGGGGIGRDRNTSDSIATIPGLDDTRIGQVVQHVVGLLKETGILKTPISSGVTVADTNRGYVPSALPPSKIEIS